MAKAMPMTMTVQMDSQGPITGRTNSARSISTPPAAAASSSGSRSGWRIGRRSALSGVLAASLAATAAVPANAQVIAQQTSSEYHHAIAAGYKALMLCEGVIAAGRTEAQVSAVELRGIYPEYDAIVPKLRASIDRKARTVSVPFAADLPPRRAEWGPRTGCVLAPIGGTARVAPAFTTAPALPAPADPRPWPMGDALSLIHI